MAPALYAQHRSYAFTVERGQFLKDVSWHDSIYRFPTFQEGSLNFTKQQGQTLKALYNYNIFLDRIEIISDQGDTIPVKNSAGIQFININNTIFFNHKSKGFLEINLIGKLNVAIKYTVKVFMESGTGERFSVSDNGFRETSTKYDRVYTKEKSYYLLDEDLNLYHPTVQNVIKFLPSHEDEIYSFFKANKLDLRKPEDFMTLAEHCRNMK